jgi:hypothetical protein
METGTSRLGDLLGNMRSLMTGNFKRQLEGSGKGASLFVGALLGGFFLGIRKDMNITGSGYEGSLSIGTLLGNMQGGSFTGNFEGKVLKKVLETDAYFLRGPLGNLGVR